MTLVHSNCTAGMDFIPFRVVGRRVGLWVRMDGESPSLRAFGDSTVAQAAMALPSHLA